MTEETPNPCPDCGSGAATHQNANGHYVFCSNDDCGNRPCTRVHSSEQAAIIAWNNHETY